MCKPESEDDSWLLIRRKTMARKVDIMIQANLVQKERDYSKRTSRILFYGQAARAWLKYKTHGIFIESGFIFTTIPRDFHREH